MDSPVIEIDFLHQLLHFYCFTTRYYKGQSLRGREWLCSARGSVWAGASCPFGSEKDSYLLWSMLVSLFCSRDQTFQHPNRKLLSQNFVRNQQI